MASLRRASLIVLAGSVAGFGINLALTPVLTRLYEPATFGMFSTILAVGTAFVGISTFRLEVRAQAVADDAEARALRTLALRWAVLWATIVTLGATLGVAGGADLAWLLVGVFVLGGSLQLVGTAALTRRRAYRNLSINNFVQGAGTGLLQAGLGAVHVGMGALVAGFAIPRLVWMRGVSLRSGGVGGLKQTWQRHRSFALVAGGSAGINSLAGQGFVVLVAATYGAVSAALVAMAMRVLVSPLSIIGQAAAAAGIGEVGKLLRDNRSHEAAATVEKGVRDLVAVGALPCLAAALLAPRFAGAIFGAEWHDVGVVLAWMALGALPQFAVAPFSQVLNVAGASSTLLRWDITRLLFTAGTIVLPSWCHQDLSTAVGLYSCAQVILYLALYFLIRAHLRGQVSAHGEV